MKGSAIGVDDAGIHPLKIAVFLVQLQSTPVMGNPCLAKLGHTDLLFVNISLIIRLFQRNIRLV